MRVFVDFDGTITKEHGPIEQSVPNEDLRSYLRVLKAAGYEICIYSCRSNPEICDPEDESKMIQFLIDSAIPFDKIVKDKPYFDILIDDRAINVNDIPKPDGQMEVS